MSSDTPERTLLQDKTRQLTGSWEDEVADTAGTCQPGGHGGGDGSLGEVVQGHGHCCSGDQALHYCVRSIPGPTALWLCLDTHLSPRPA